jgi:hypothetical protein
MTRKDFVLIASSINDLPLMYDTKKLIAQHFADRLSSTNQAFNRQRFILACCMMKNDAAVTR